MLYNEKTYSYTLRLNLAGDKEVKEKLSSVSDYLDEYEKKMTETYVTPFEKAQKTTRFIEGNFRPAILTGIKDIDLLNLSLDKQIIEMADWGKAVGSIIPLLGKVHKEAEKMKRIHNTGKPLASPTPPPKTRTTATRKFNKNIKLFVYRRLKQLVLFK